jgi:N-acetylglutamate synthase-like GNAT family acetyltransferase
MEVAQKTIKEITGASLDDSLRIIRSAFGKVAGELGITMENAPRFPAFITYERLEEMKAGGAVFFGTFVNGSQAGVVALEKEATGEYYMKRLAILPEYWHGGMGRELVNYVIDHVRRLGVKKLYIAMVNEQAVLKSWYQGIGFKEIAVKKFEHLPFNVCFMEMDIA